MVAERLIREIEDSDFGRLSLWEEKLKGGQSVDGPLGEILVYRWRGELDGLHLIVMADDASDRALSALSEAERASIRGLAGRKSELREQGAHALLELARDWSGDASLTWQQVMNTLQLDAVHVWGGGSSAIQLWFNEIEHVFGAQPILAYGYLDAHGDIEDVNLVA